MDDDKEAQPSKLGTTITGKPITGDPRRLSDVELRESLEAARFASDSIARNADTDELARKITASPIGLTLSPADQVLAIKTVVDKANQNVAEIDSKINGFSDYIEQMRAELEKQRDAHQAFRNVVNDPMTEVEGFRAKVVEELKLKEARKLWSDRATRARREYIGSCILLAVLLILVPALAIWQSQAIFGFFRKIGEAVLVDLPENASETAILISAVSRLVLVTMPVALYIWLIRIVVRFNMRSLLLIDDAEQRNTMLETYLHLVERDADVKADRPLILEALFRRTPGHGPETIEPPNLADVMRLGGKPSGPV
jgi:hypothetical protein